MQTNLYILSLFLGVILAVHLAMNGEVGKKMDNAQVANAVFWCIGALTAVIIGVTGWQRGALAPLAQVDGVWDVFWHGFLLTAGMMGACLVFAIAWLGPQIGWGNLMITLLAGQVVTGIVLSHFGWLGSPQQPITIIKIVGVVIMVVGVVLTTWSSATPASGNAPLN